MRKSKIKLDENKDNKIKKNIKIDEKQLDAIEEELKDNKEIKEKKDNKLNSKKRKKVFFNLIIAIIITVYFSFLIIGSNRIEDIVYLKIIKIASFVNLLIGLVFFEIAMRKDNESIFLSGVEIVSVGGVTLYVLDLFSKQNENLDKILCIVIGVYVVYYLLKSFIIAVKKKKKEDEN